KIDHYGLIRKMHFAGRLQSIYEILQILSINIFDKEPLNLLFAKPSLQYFKEQNYNQLILFDL
ncbi:MAG TPA: hypothetical protein PLB59_11475, partial [Bacteroidales bacterium]|nr:hypothetical protein [Bacteroidales bacterium]HQN15754.1 hypothetical protein [Bacteroidales bacterium]HQP16576.1 hypothetical protein [Bacteroidales bacterium]